MDKKTEAINQALAWAKDHGQAVLAGGGMPALVGMNNWTAALIEALGEREEQAAQQPVNSPRLCRDCADFGPICPNDGKPCSDAALAEQEPVATAEDTIFAGALQGLLANPERYKYIASLVASGELSQAEATQKNINKARKIAKQALAEQSAQQEPVAWGIVASNTGRICQVALDFDEVADHNPKHIIPLYTSPPAQRQPLNPTVPEGKDIYNLPAFLLGWKAAEAAHGIKEQP